MAQTYKYYSILAFPVFQHLNKQYDNYKHKDICEDLEALSTNFRQLVLI